LREGERKAEKDWEKIEGGGEERLRV